MISINKNLIAIFALSAFLFAGCIQQSNTYPVEIFSEMHYNQAQKYQEPPRVPAHPDSVPFNGIGEKSNLDMSQKIQSINNGSELYSVNCAFCHGDMGDGYGPAAEKITSKDKTKLVKEYINKTLSKSELERQENEKNKTGVFIGNYALNPISNKKIPIWISNCNGPKSRIICNCLFRRRS